MGYRPRNSVDPPSGEASASRVMSITEMNKDKLFDDRYEFLDSLGQGSWGEVVRAFDRVRSHVVALRMSESRTRMSWSRSSLPRWLMR